VLLPEPASGRVFRGTRRVRTSDASPKARLRLDALAGYLQDVSADDTAAASLEDDLAWVVRRLLVEVKEPARFRELLTLRTWCSGTGRSWAERRVSVAGDRGARAETVVLWVRVDIETGHPVRLSEGFFEMFGEAAGDRRVSARLSLPAEPAPDATISAWPLRFADFDLMGHVNNAAYLAAVEEVLAARDGLRVPLRLEIEYRRPIERGANVEVHTSDSKQGLGVWLCEASDGETYAAARVTPV